MVQLKKSFNQNNLISSDERGSKLKVVHFKSPKSKDSQRGNSSDEQENGNQNDKNSAKSNEIEDINNDHLKIEQEPLEKKNSDLQEREQMSKSFSLISQLEHKEITNIVDLFDQRDNLERDLFDELKSHQESLKKQMNLDLKSINQYTPSRLYFYSTQFLIYYKQIFTGQLIFEPVYKLLLVTFTLIEISAFLMTDYSFRTHSVTKDSILINRVSDDLQLICNSAFSLEVLLMIIAYGLVKGKHTYLKGIWNVVCLIILMCGWIQWADIDNQIIHIIHYFRIITFFRLFPQLEKKVNAFFASFSHLGKTFFPLICFVTFYAIIGISFFQGHIESRCRLTPKPDLINQVWAIDTKNLLPCGSLECPSGTYCGNPADYGMPVDKNEFFHNENMLFGYSNFNSIEWSLFSVYNFLMVNGWIQTISIYWRAQEKWIAGIYFVTLVLILSQVFSNIILATMYEGFLDMTSIKLGDQMDKKKKKNLKILNLKRQQVNNYDSQEDKNNYGNNKRQNDQVQSFHDSKSNIKNLKKNNSNANTEKSNTELIKIKNLTPSFQVLEGIRQSKAIKAIFLANIILSIIVLCIDQYDISDKTYRILNQIDFTIIIVLFIEVLLNMLSNGLNGYFNENMNKLDLFVLVIHVISYGLELGNEEDIFFPKNQLYIFIRCLKMLRIYKVLYTYELFESMKVLLKTYYLTLKSIPEYFFVFIILIVLFSHIGRDLFAYIQPHNDHEVLRINFNTVHESIIAVVMIFFNEEWHITMYKYMRYVGYKSILFHLICMLICQILFIRLFIAIFINKFMKWLHIHEKEYSQNKDQLQTIQALFISLCRSIYQTLCCCFIPKKLNKVYPSTQILKKQPSSLKIEKEDPPKIELINKNNTKSLSQFDNLTTAQRLLIQSDLDLKNNNNNQEAKQDDQFYNSGQKNFEELKNRQPTLQGFRGSRQFQSLQFNSLSIDTSVSGSNKKRNIPQIKQSMLNPVNQRFQQVMEPSPQNGVQETISSDTHIQMNNDKEDKNVMLQKLTNFEIEQNINKQSNLNENQKNHLDDYIDPKQDNLQMVDIMQNSLKQLQSLSMKESQQDQSQKNIHSASQIYSKESKEQIQLISNRTSQQVLMYEENRDENKSKFYNKLKEFGRQKNNNSNNINDEFNNSDNQNGKGDNFNEQSQYFHHTQPFHSKEIIYQTSKQIPQKKYQNKHDQVDQLRIKSLNIPDNFIIDDGQEQTYQESQVQYSKQNSLYIFSEDNPIRTICCKLVKNIYFDICMCLSIILLAILLAWDSPFIDNQSEEKKIINILILCLSCVFLLDNLIHAIALGFIFNGPDSYFQKNLMNILNFITALACLLYSLDISKKINFFIKYFAIFRFIILLSYLSKYIRQIEFSGKLILFCGNRMIKLILFGIIYLLMNAIIATKLLKGTSWKCLFENGSAYHSLIQTKYDCIDLGGDWIESLYNYNSLIQSLQNLFMVQSSEGWLVIMYDTFDSTSLNKVSKYNQSSLWVIFYSQFFFIANICILNMFVGVVVESFQELIDRETKQEGLNKQQKEWYFIKQSIYNLVPQRMIKRPANPFRRYFYDYMIHRKILKYVFYFFTILNCISFLAHRNRMTDSYLYILRIINLICLVVIFIEIVVKFSLYQKQYFKWLWNYLDILALTVGFLNIYYQLTEEITIFSSFYRILDGIAKGIQLLRFYRILKNFVVFKKLFKSLHFALSSIFGILIVLIIFLLTSVILALNLFPYLKEQATINSYDINFRTFSQALFSLIRVVTSEYWLVIPSEASSTQSPNFVCREDMYDYSDFVKYGYNSCGSVVSYFFFCLFYLIFTLIILNIFIATIIESYKQAFSADESAINHYQFDDILQLWTEFDPEGKGHISYKEFWQFSSRIAIIYGVDSKELLDIENKGQFLKTLNIPIFEDPINKIFCYKFHDVIVKLSKASVQIKYGVYNLEHDDLEKRIELDKTIKVRKIKGQDMIRETPFSSSDMVMMIVLSRKVKQWKKKFIEKEVDANNLFNLQKVAQKLKASIQQINSIDEQEDQNQQQNDKNNQIDDFNRFSQSQPFFSEKEIAIQQQKQKQKSMNFLQVPSPRFQRGLKKNKTENK